MEYNFRKIEEYWQEKWKEDQVYKVSNDFSKPKHYVLDMFPYPSGTGLHVGHPLGYIASDIFARYKRLKGFNVLHPMGYDAFGLPAEQYAIEHGIHPAVSTAQNIKNFRAQLDRIGFCFDWSREVNTSYPSYYKWTQWIFLKLFESFYNRMAGKADRIENLVRIFQREGNINHPVPVSSFQLPGGSNPLPAAGNQFTSRDWNGFDEKTRQDILMEYRIAYCGYGDVNWCEALGTVLANDEVINGLSERGGFPVVKKKLRQWYLRITEYADRLLEGLEQVESTDAMKEMQSNWVGKSYGAEIDFHLSSQDMPAGAIRVFTTRPDTIFGVDFMVVAPEHELIEKMTTPARKKAVDEYISYVKNRNERERMAEKKISGVFTGAYAIHPFDKREIPVWISEYVLAGYGTGAIMAVPCGDERDHKFARHFNIPVTNIIGPYYTSEEANPTKDAVLENSDFLNGIVMRDAIPIVINKLENEGIGKRRVHYKMRDAAFSRQRYWGEPIPIIWENGIAYPLGEQELPLELPYVDSYQPGPEGEGPLANIPEWRIQKLETNTMPGYAGSSWYFLRYMDPYNDQQFCSRRVSDYWGQVDLYIGGTEHAVGHLLYSRMWTKALYDLGLIGFDEPYRRLFNQGMITGKSYFLEKMDFVSTGMNARISLYAHHGKNREFYGEAKKLIIDGIEYSYVAHFDERLKYAHRFVDAKDRLTENALVEYIAFMGADAGLTLNDFIWETEMTENGERYVQTKMEVEKMSKSKFNVENPDHLCDRYGADTFRMYEMFLGPVEQSKPWDTKGIEGVHRFLKKLWRLFYDELKGQVWNEGKATDAEWKVLHKTIRKIEEDTERLAFNTAVSAAMIAVNELGDLRCSKKEVLEPLLIILSPYAPHVSEELWHLLGHTRTILDAAYPKAEEKFLVESTKNYPIALNGKTRTEMNISLDATQQQVEEIILANETIKKWLQGKKPKRIIYVKNKMINVVV